MSARRCPPWPARGCRRRRRWCARPRRSSSRTRSASPPRPPCCSTSRRTTSIVTAPSRPTVPPSSRSSRARGRGRSRWRRRRSRARSRGRRSTWRSATGRAPASPTATGRCGGTESGWSATTRSASAAPTTARTRWPPRRWRSRAGCPPRRAAAVRRARGLPPAAVRDGLGTFAGVAHRLEEVATVDGVLYVNDSKATNVASAIAGIESFDGGLHVVLGGSRKAADFAPLAAPVAERAVAAYLIGETAPEIAAALAGTGVPLHDCRDLERALAAARAAARPGEVVLLSPACASFDQYADYEARGAHFRTLVEGAARGRRNPA